MTKLLKDSFSMKDKAGAPLRSHHKPTLWTHTQIIGGYGLHKNAETGLSELDEVVFETENMVPIGGVQFAMEQIFGVASPLVVPSLSANDGIGATDSTMAGSDGNPHPYGTKVCLFGIGIEGAATNNLTANEVTYMETAVSGMIPFRYTNQALSSDDQTRYFGKKQVNDTTAYYLKTFDQNAVIHNFKASNIEGEDGAEVTSDELNKAMDKQVQSLTEMNLTISRKDIKEWFTSKGHVDQSCVNSIALYSAVYDAAKKDYTDIHLFSKLNIPTEPMSLTKDMHIIYRVYGS